MAVLYFLVRELDVAEKRSKLVFIGGCVKLVLLRAGEGIFLVTVFNSFYRFPQCFVLFSSSVFYSVHCFETLL